ncbi:MAG: hypothetical protein Q7T56_01135 [Nocardioidaceae bacterium]|nr:hypothetical protein [Nocardioidaceae bacterium]
MSADPFERLRVDLESALTDLTVSTRARLDDIDLSVPRVDARPAVRRVEPAVVPPAPVDEPAAEAPRAPPRPGSPPVRVRGTVRNTGTRIEVPAARPAAPPAAASPPRPVATRPSPVEPSPGPSAPPRRRRRAVVVAAVLVAVVAVLVGGFLVARPAGDPSARTVASGAVDPAAAPASAPVPGRLVEVVPGAGGSVEVVQWLAFEEPVRSVDVAPGSRRDGRRATSVTVRGAGVDTVEPAASGDRQRVTFSGPTDRVRVSYVVRDAVRTSGDDEARGLVDLTAFSVVARGSDPGGTVLRVRGADVRGVACGRTLRAVRPCGTERGRGWSLRTPSTESTTLLATVDLGR